MKFLCFVTVLAAFCLAGCATPGAAYARAHPELSSAHRQILISGKISGGLAVEGMTKEQVRLAMGNPETFLKVNGDDAWVYVRQQYLDISPRSDSNSSYGSGSNSQRNFTETANLGPRPSTYEKTTVFFRGDRASYARVTVE